MLFEHLKRDDSAAWRATLQQCDAEGLDAAIAEARRVLASRTDAVDILASIAAAAHRCERFEVRDRIVAALQSLGMSAEDLAAAAEPAWPRASTNATATTWSACTRLPARSPPLGARNRRLLAWPASLHTTCNTMNPRSMRAATSHAASASLLVSRLFVMPPPCPIDAVKRARVTATVAGSRLGALERNGLGTWQATQQAGQWQRRGASWREQGCGERPGVSVGRAAPPPQGGRR